MAEQLTFSGTPNAVYSAPSGWTNRGDNFRMGPDGLSICGGSIGTYSQLVSDTASSGIYRSRVLFDRIAAGSGDSIAATLIDSSRNGIAAEMGGSTIYVQKQVGGSNSGLILSVADLPEGLGENYIDIILDENEGNFEVLYNGESVAIGVYTDFLSGLNAGGSLYRDGASINITIKELSSDVFDSILHISSDPYVTPSEGETTVISRSITAIAGDVIYCSITWRKAGGAMTAMSWNGQTLAKIGATLDDGEAFTEAYWVQASAGATSNLTATLAGGQHYTIVTNVGRPPADTVVILGGLEEEIYSSGAYSDPSLPLAGVPAGSLSVSMLHYMGWNTSYDPPLTVTLTADAPFSTGDGDTNTNYRGVWALFIARDNASTGSVVAEWSRSNSDEPMYAHRAFYFSTVASASILDIDQLIEGQATTITFSEPYTPTILTIDDGDGGVSTVSIFSGAADTWTFTCPALSDGVIGPRLGSVGVTAGDGDNTTASFASTYTKTGYTAVIIESLGDGNVGAGFNPPLKVGNQEAFDGTKGEISVAGIFTGTYTGEQTVWDHNVDDFKWRSFIIETIDGEVVIDETPNPFSFTSVSSADPSTPYTSSEVIISGLNVEVDVTIVGGEYSKNGGSFTSADGVINNSDTLELKITSSVNPMDSVNSTVTVGTFSATFRVSGPGAGSGGSDGGDEFGTIYLTARGM